RTRQLGQHSADLVDPRGVELQRDEVGLGEIAVVVRELLGAHRARVATVRVPEPGLLDDPLASVERLGLALDLELKSPLNVAEGVHVLDLDLGAEPLDRGEDRKSTRLNSSHDQISYAVFCLKKKNQSTDLI